MCPFFCYSAWKSIIFQPGGNSLFTFCDDLNEIHAGKSALSRNRLKAFVGKALLRVSEEIHNRKPFTAHFFHLSPFYFFSTLFLFPVTLSVFLMTSKWNQFHRRKWMLPWSGPWNLWPNIFPPGSTWIYRRLFVSVKQHFSFFFPFPHLLSHTVHPHALSTRWRHFTGLSRTKLSVKSFRIKCILKDLKATPDGQELLRQKIQAECFPAMKQVEVKLKLHTQAASHFVTFWPLFCSSHVSHRHVHVSTAPSVVTNSVWGELRGVPVLSPARAARFVIKRAFTSSERGRGAPLHHTCDMMRNTLQQDGEDVRRISPSLNKCCQT